MDTNLVKVVYPLRTKEVAMTNPLGFDDLQAHLAPTHRSLA